jgi:hypothetical protein
VDGVVLSAEDRCNGSAGGRLTYRLLQGALGVIWAVGEALMAFNPPPHDFRRAAAVPLVGWVAIYLAI